LSPDVWVPGAAEPSLDDFVERVHRQIERYTTTHTAEETHVEVELGGGELLTLVSLSGEPGFGFLTLSVQLASGVTEDHIVPIGGPSSGVRDPEIYLTYNARATNESYKFGYGWADSYNPTIIELDANNAGVVHGDGSTTFQANKDGSGDYDSEGRNSLQKVGSTWVETTPQKWKLYYDSSGAHTRSLKLSLSSGLPSRLQKTYSLSSPVALY